MPISQELYSCESSQQVGEQLFGTATRADVWFCLEYARPWGAEAFAESSIPDSVKQHLASALGAVPKSRLELIKRRFTSGALSFYVALSQEVKATLYRFHLDSYDDLLKIDIPAVVSGNPAYQQHISDEPAFLVCANGRRDICCARYGLPIYEAMSRHAADQTWQCSHVGGHRFAANAVFLPEGICYGRIDEPTAGSLIDRYRQEQIQLETYRGRSCYDEPVQAADYFLRAETGLLGLHDFRLAGVEREGDSGWVVQFGREDNGKKHQIRLAQDKPGVAVYKTTGDAEAAWVPQYRLVDYS
jgi:hypothetical protein